MRQLLMTLLLLLTTGHVAAQQGLAINELFSGSIIPKERMVETRNEMDYLYESLLWSYGVGHKLLMAYKKLRGKGINSRKI